MLPELDIMRAELSQLESLGAHLPVRAIEQVKHPEIPKVQVTNPEPARPAAKYPANAMAGLTLMEN